MAVLTNKSIASTYTSLLSIGDTSTSSLSGSIQSLTDGTGQLSPLAMSTTQIQFNTSTNTFKFPADRGTINQILKLADANGTLSWADDNFSNTLNFSGGGSTAGSIALNTQTLAFTGTTNEIVTSASNQAITLSFPTAGVVLPNGSSATTQASTDSSTKVATTAYVKSVVSAEDLDTAGDSGTGSIDLDSQSLSVLGTVNEITTVAATQNITLSFPTTGVTLPNGSVATTQTASDDSTKVATTEYVTDAIGLISFDVTKTGTITENQIAVWNDSTDELRSDETVTIGTDHSITLLQKNSVGADLTSININGGNVAVTTGTRNTGFGYENLNAITSGSNNTAIGYSTLKALAFGGGNTAIGMNALNKATGSNNVAIGVNAGQDVLANGSNTVIGYQSYEFGTSQSSVAIGYQSLRGGSTTNTGQGNTAIGYQSLSGITNGFQNIAIGYQSGLAMSSGDKNVIIGSFSGQAGSFDIRASDNNIILSDGDGNIRQWMDANGKLQLPDYGSGTHSGTLAKSLGVDTSGNVIEFTSGAGTGTVAGTGTAGTITKWATGGADIEDSVIVESGGNVGIGTDDPESDLDIFSTSIPTIQLTDQDVEGNYKGYLKLVGNDLSFLGSNGATKFYVGGNRDGNSNTNLALTITSGGRTEITTLSNDDTLILNNTGTYAGSISFNQRASNGTLSNAGYAGSIRAFEGNGTASNGIGLFSRTRMSFYIDSSTPALTISTGGAIGQAVTPISDPYVAGAEQWMTYQIGKGGIIGAYKNNNESMFGFNTYVSAPSGNNKAVISGINGTAMRCYADQITFNHLASSGTSQTQSRLLTLLSGGDVILGAYKATPASTYNKYYYIKSAPYFWDCGNTYNPNYEIAAIAMGAPGTGQDDGEILFQTAQNVCSNNASSVLTTRARILETGEFEMYNGIRFPNQSSPTAGSISSSTLDAYEEGTWTPVVRFGTSSATTYTSHVAVYTRIGNVVYIQVSINNIGNTGSGSLFIEGLPYAVGASASFGDVQGTIRWQGISTGSGNQMSPYFFAGQSKIAPQIMGGAGYLGAVSSSMASNGWYLYGCEGFYMI